ncbi:phosphotransferase [Terrabacter sp. LjRoot27]|uniref:phosphotransferase family protein n=1 Tax=Terrabacter sp. LjRoot27 TaxID=3342306 RepID=UPI003ECDF86D
MVSLTPWIDAPRLSSPPQQTADDRRAVTDVLGRLHAATPHAVGVAGTDDLRLPERDLLDRALATDLPPGVGPYGARARDALAEQADAVRRALAVWDEHAVRAHAERDSWVITHGEPHWRNVLSGADGLHVVDWDTALLAPAARDLWHVAGAEGAGADVVLADYAALTGRRVSTDDLRAQALRWDLTEVALYAAWFGRPHADDADGEIAWGGFTESLSSVGARGSAG